MAGDKSEIALYQALVDRFQSLEASLERLREQFDELVQENNKIIKNKEVDDDMVGSDSDSRWVCFPGFFGAGVLYRSVLENMGHAVHGRSYTVFILHMVGSLADFISFFIAIITLLDCVEFLNSSSTPLCFN
uniref:Uncharacterized protein n=1 Tax=Quercus lobata TaxID=97700 RepID=A0A7N2LIN3_QUELO